MTLTTRQARLARVQALRKRNRAWIWRPQWHWFGWKTLLPVQVGHDEFSRWTLVLGWTVTGRVIIALRECTDAECREFAQ